MDAIRAFHDLKVDPDQAGSDGEDGDMVTARLRDFMKPTYWQSLHQSVQARAGMLKRYRNTQKGSSQYAKEIGRKYAQSQIELQLLERDIEHYDQMLVKEKNRPLPSYVRQGFEPLGSGTIYQSLGVVRPNEELASESAFLPALTKQNSQNLANREVTTHIPEPAQVTDSLRVSDRTTQRRYMGIYPNQQDQQKSSIEDGKNNLQDTQSNLCLDQGPNSKIQPPSPSLQALGNGLLFDPTTGMTFLEEDESGSDEEEDDQQNVQGGQQQQWIQQFQQPGMVPQRGSSMPQLHQQQSQQYQQQDPYSLQGYYPQNLRHPPQQPPKHSSHGGGYRDQKSDINSGKLGRKDVTDVKNRSYTKGGHDRDGNRGYNSLEPVKKFSVHEDMELKPMKGGHNRLSHLQQMPVTTIYVDEEDSKRRRPNYLRKSSRPGHRNQKNTTSDELPRAAQQLQPTQQRTDNINHVTEQALTEPDLLPSISRSDAKLAPSHYPYKQNGEIFGQPAASIPPQKLSSQRKSATEMKHYDVEQPQESGRGSSYYAYEFGGGSQDPATKQSQESYLSASVVAGKSIKSSDQTLSLHPRQLPKPQQESPHFQQTSYDPYQQELKPQVADKEGKIARQKGSHQSYNYSIKSSNSNRYPVELDSRAARALGQEKLIASPPTRIF